MFANILSFLGGTFGDIQSKECLFLFIDEPECPKSLIK